MALFCSVILFAAEEQKYPTLAIGSPAPDFSLPCVDGKTYSLNSFKSARVLVVIFTSNHCPTAQAYEDRVNKLADDFRDKGVTLIAINPNSPVGVRVDELGYTDVGDTFEDMKIRAKDRHYRYVYLNDGETEEVSMKYGPIATPHAFVFDEKRILRFQGRIDDSERASMVKVQDTRLAIEALLAGNEPPVTTTKVIGCSTKWGYKAEANKAWLEKLHQQPTTLAAADVDALKALRENKTDKIRLINVWATWCGPCVSEFDDLIDTHLRFRQRDFEVITVAAQFPDEEAKVKRFLAEHHAITKNYIFGGTDKYKLLEALDPEWNGALPHTLVVMPGGEVVFRAGELEFLELRRKLLPLLDKVAPWPATKEK